MIFFTSDHHFGHAKVIEYSRRPFKDVIHMREEMIRRWNSVVQERDEVYHLGDMFLGRQDDARAIRDRLNGRIYFIKGNHDKLRGIEHFFEWTKDMHYLRYEGRRIVLCHYALRTWQNSNHGSWHLHGHSHGNLPPLGYSMDVGVDAWDYYPVSFAVVEREMLKRGPGLEIDHHKES